MVAKLLALTSLTVLGLMLTMPATPVAAKQNYTYGATLSGGSLVSAVYVPLVMSGNYDEMQELPNPSIGQEDLRFELVMHYDFSESGNGLRDWTGRFDGRDRLYFPDSMVVGRGVWKEGWYRAADLLAKPLQQAITAAESGLPATGTGDTNVTGENRNVGVFSAAVLFLIAMVLIPAAVWRAVRERR